MVVLIGNNNNNKKKRDPTGCNYSIIKDIPKSKRNKPSINNI